MSEGAVRDAAGMPPADLLALAVQRLLAEEPVDLPGPSALERCGRCWPRPNGSRPQH